MSRLGKGETYCDWCQLALAWRNGRWESTLDATEDGRTWECPARDDDTLPHEPESAARRP